MATLDQVVDQLKENNEVTLGVESALLKLIKITEDAHEGNKLQREEDKREAKKAAAKPIVASGGSGGGTAGGMGASLAGLGSGLMKFGVGSAAGMAALGVALPAFFGGLTAGNEGLAWLDRMGADFNYTALGNAVEGFGGLITRASPEALIALAGLMAVEGFAPNPVKGALGLAAMGAAIPAFLGGLLIGDSVFEAAQNWLGADFDFAATGRVLEGFSSMIGNLTPGAGIALAALLGGGFLVSKLADKNPLKVGLAMAVMGAAIPALIGGLLLGEAALAGAQWLGATFDFNLIGAAFEGFSSAIAKLTPEAGIALASLLGAGGLITAFGGGLGDAVTIAAVMTGLGAGISGLMIGLSVGEVGLGWISKLQAEGGGGLAWMFETFSNAVDKLSEPATKHLAIILGAGTALGAFLGAATTPAGALMAAAGIALTMTGIGAGISGLMIGLGAGEVGLSWLSKLQNESSGGGLAWAMGAFNDAILAISDEAITKMATIATSGAGGGLKDLALGMIGFLTAEGMSEVGNVWGTIKDGVQGAVNWLFGTNFGENDKSTIEKMVDSLEPLNTLDNDMIRKMSSFGDAMTAFSHSFESLGQIETGQAGPRLAAMMTDIGAVMNMMDTFIKGGVYDTGTGPAIRWFGSTRGLIDFGPGLENMDLTQLDKYAEGLQAMRVALGVEAPQAAPAVARVDTSLPETLQNLYVENLVLRNGAGGATVYVDASSNPVTSVSGGGGPKATAPTSYDIGAVRRGGFVQ